VHRESSQATFPLKFSEAIKQEDVNLECLFVYATPLAFIPYDDKIVSLTRQWGVTATLEYLPGSNYLAGLGLKGVTPETFLHLATEFQKQVLILSDGPYSFMESKLSCELDTDTKSLLLELPPGWYAEFSSKSLAEILGFDAPLTADAIEKDDGKYILKNPFNDIPALIVGSAVNKGPLIIQQQPNTTISVKFGPTLTTKTASYDSVRPKIEGNSSLIKTWVNEAVTELLGALGLNKNLVTCKADKTGLTLLANQDLEHQPILLKFTKNKPLASDLHSIEVPTTVLHFNLTPFQAATVDASSEGLFANWGTIVPKKNLVWTDPLKKIAPFYLLADGQEGSSLMDTNFVSVAALVGSNLQVKERTTLKIRTRQNQLTLRFVDSYLEECVFASPFNVFLVCRIF